MICETFSSRQYDGENYAKDYFSNEADGGWKDLTAAGYLLSNAFRRSSSTAPDSLPAVKVCIGQNMALELLFFSKYH